MPKVSVIVPIFNVEKYIERCARSLFNQTLDDIEYIFINDCTPDRSIEVLREVLLSYPNRKGQCKIVDLPQNSGQAAVRNLGIEIATGDYIIHCDSDDWVDKDMYRLMYEKAIEGDYDIVRCKFARCNNKIYIESSNINNEHYKDRLLLIRDLLNGNDLSSLCDKLIKSSLYNHNNIIYPTNNMCEDFMLVAQLFFYSKRIAFINKVMYYYYQREGSICRDSSEIAILSRYNQQKDNFDKIISFIERNRLDNVCKSELYNMKFRIRTIIEPLLNNSRYYNLWKNTYPEISFSKISGLKRKVRYTLVYLRLYKLLEILNSVKFNLNNIRNKV